MYKTMAPRMEPNSDNICRAYIIVKVLRKIQASYQLSKPEHTSISMSIRQYV